jgi:hypothetical protein
MARPLKRLCVAVTAVSMFGAVATLAPVASSSPAAAAALSPPVVSHASGNASWSVLRNPLSPLAPSRDALDSISCTSGVHCMAVGSGYNTALAEKWNGSRWLIVPTPAPRGRVLQSVACTSLQHCTAVGYSANDPNGLSANTLAESWNGSRWTVVPTPTRARAVNLLESVSCTSATNCVAVGYEGDGTTLAPLAERWDGTKWSVMAAAPPVGAFESGLFAIACISYQNCLATGASTSRNSTVPLSEHWDGHAWSILAMPAPAGADESFLNGLSCVSPVSCQAVGVAFVDSQTTFSESTLAERWNGSKWSIVASPNVGGGAVNLFDEVSCKTPSNCFAVGTAESDSASDVAAAKPLIAHWNGHNWSRVRSASQPGLLQSGLSGVACPGVNSCTAVGTALARNAPGDIPHVEHWNGAEWSVVSAQRRPGPHRAVLSAVSCVATGQCRAVGQSASGALIERWSGRNWAIMQPAAAPDRYVSLVGISCVTASACFAVGGAVGARDGIPVAERWDGRRWARTSVPAPMGKTDSALSGVSCSRADSCMAVGAAFDLSSSGFDGNVLAERWNGKKWSSLKVPGPSGGLAPQLASVSCSTPNDCVAVGSYFAISGPHGLIERWNGKKWSPVPNPTPAGAFGIQLSGVSCPAPGACTAVGSVFTTGGVRPLVERSIGNSWSEVVQPIGPSRNSSSALSAVSCASTSRCTAIGAIQRFSLADVGISPSGDVLTERLDGTSWSVVSSPDVPDSIGQGLSGVSCRRDNFCMGVGFLVRVGNGAQQALAESLD